MKVIFLQNIKGVAKTGDVKDVLDGYARNFLLARKLAKPATPETVKQAETLKKKDAEAYVTSKEGALELTKRFEGLVLEMKEDANEEGHLYGSVNQKKIAHALKEKGIKIREEQINLPEHRKTTGEHEVELELHPEVKVKIKVLVATN